MEISLDKLEIVARKLLDQLEVKNEATVIGLKGDLGSGKTTFTQTLGKILGIKDRITSPTFVIQKRYKIEEGSFENLIHIDAYRLKDGNELLALDWEEINKNPKNLILIEWPEIVSDVLKDIKVIEFSVIDDVTRRIEL